MGISHGRWGGSISKSPRLCAQVPSAASRIRLPDSQWYMWALASISGGGVNTQADKWYARVPLARVVDGVGLFLGPWV